MDVWPPEFVSLSSGSARIVWRRSARARRISLRIDLSDGTVVVTLPTRAGREAGLALLRTHADWVAERLAALPDSLPFVEGSLIPIAGVAHRIRHRADTRGAAWLEGGELHVTGDPAFIGRRVRDFLQAEARRRLIGLIAPKATRVGRTPSRVTVKDTSSRWGSCSATGALAFSWRLVMAPEFVQDYVAGHEVAHLRHMNHRPEFWSLVAELTPHTAKAVPWLRQEGPRLLRAG